jgi:hypothetical protein
MSDHLPECRYVNDRGCICQALRACEERVHDSWSSFIKVDEERAVAYAAGLDAARSAVAAIEYRNESGTVFDWPIIDRPEALAAIDALRVNP